VEELRLHDAVVFLAAAGILIPIVKRLRINPVLGFLLIGLALGPHGLARLADSFPWLGVILITDPAGVRALAELGVVFLLFMIGLELSVERLWALRRLVFGLGTAQIAVTAVIVGLVAHAFGNSVEASVVLGLCLALSSTAVVVQLLTDEGRFGSTVGRASFGILLAQDLAVVPVLFVVGALGNPTGSLAQSLAIATVSALVAVIVILLVGRRVVRPLFRLVGSARSPEVFMAATLLIILACAALTEAAGLSAALGAFLAGLLIAETEFRHEIEVNIEPFKGLLMGVFFLSIGMFMDLAELLRQPALIAMSVVGLLTIKTAVTFALARAFGLSTGQALETGLLLGQGGEFAFAVIALATGLALLPLATSQFMLLVVTATLFATPLVARGARALAERIEPTRGSASDVLDIAPALSGHVVIAGYGRLGRLLAEILDRQQIAHVALDLDVDRVATLHARGAPVYHGDASRPALLAKAHLDGARALAITMDDPDAVEQVVRAARGARSDLPILARARDASHATRLIAAGATHVVPEVLEAGLQLGQILLGQVGLSAEAARDLIEQQRMSAHEEFEADGR
jgi:CPA2 family monovalent cation:H+ antiporter-2